MNKFILLFISILIFNICFAQGSISGKIIDSATAKPLSLATVTVFNAADTSLITYRLSNNNGDFKIPGLPINIENRVLISFSGYSVYRKEFLLTNDKPDLDLGTISLPTDAQSLDEVLVYAERPPVTVRRDTIEFNAAAFKTLPTALVEDLLKKLPGVQVDGDGNISVNGKRVNRIMVDGKEFFGNDPKMATRNLPANMIDKVQVTEDKDEKELNPDRPEGDIGQVINLKLKKGVKKGWFGKAYAGGGTDDLYEAGTILNLFKDTMQVSLIGFSNNLNRAGFGFNDIRSLGGFDRSGMNMIMMNSNGGVNVNGISFGGLGDGVNKSTGAGFNMNHVLKNNITLNSQYFYGNSRNDVEEINNQQQFLGDSILTTRFNRREVIKGNNHRVAFGLRGKIDSLSRFDFKPSFSFSDQLARGLKDIFTESNYDGLLNEGINRMDNQSEEMGYQHSLMYFKNFRKKGRTLNLSNSVDFKNNGNDQTNEVLNTFFDNGNSYTDITDQLRIQDQKNLTTNLNATYIDPLTKTLNLRLGYALNYFNNQYTIETYNKANGSEKYEIPNLSLTNDLGRISWRNTISGGLNLKIKELSITTMANFLKLDINNQFKTQGQQVEQNYTYLLPSLNVNYKSFNASYSVNVSPADIADIQPIPDNTNPLFIRYGNPDLEPSKSHSIHLNMFKNIVAKTLFFSVYLNGNIRENGITRNRVIRPDGVQESTPVNIDGQHSFYSNAHFNKQFKFKNNFQFSIGGGYNFNYDRNLLVVNSRESYVTTLGMGPSVNTGVNFNDKVEWNIRYNRNFNFSNYENDDFNDLEINTHYLNSDLVIRWPKNFVLETNLQYRYNDQVAPGIQPTVTLLNGGLTYLFLKDQKGQLKLSVHDLLNDNINVWRSTRENLITDRQLNNLQRYYLLTFTYNIRDFKAGKVGGTQRFFLF
ncbi:MAG: outer membrane beta-barrel protein [Chitinophagaceae bacterium]|jgi:hypothetical protein|nr:outer membrane beta-barrel protein [Chitinophagaceae bacterium]